MTANTRPSCPRCGYDLIGVVESWKDSCPLIGRCSECGHEFRWSVSVMSGRLGPPWSFEHARRGLVRRWWSTSWRTFLPWRFWAQMSVEHPVRIGRLVVFVMPWLILLHAATVAVVVGSRPLAPIMGSFSGRELRRVILWPYGEWIGVQTGPNSMFIDSVGSVILWGSGLTLLVPIVLLAISWPVRFLPAKRSDLLRGLCYAIPTGVVAMALMPWLQLAMMASGTHLSASVAPIAILTLLLAYPIWVTIWWWFFMRRYLGVGRRMCLVVPIAVATVLGVLVGVIVFNLSR